MTAEELASLWLGWIGPQGEPRGFVNAADLQGAMDRFNQEMIRVAGLDKVEVFDLASRIPKTRAMFYDDCHYTNEGSRAVAEQVADYGGGGRSKSGSRARRAQLEHVGVLGLDGVARVHEQPRVPDDRAVIEGTMVGDDDGAVSGRQGLGRERNGM